MLNQRNNNYIAYKKLRFVLADIGLVNVIFEWANDDTVRKNAFNPKKIKYEEHVKWYLDRLISNDSIILILTDGYDYLGQLRLDVKECNGIISYSVNKLYRKSGLGTFMINNIEKIVPLLMNKNNYEIKTLTGRVLKNNISSQACFEKNGYKKYEFDDYIEYRKSVNGGKYVLLSR